MNKPHHCISRLYPTRCGVREKLRAANGSAHTQSINCAIINRACDAHYERTHGVRPPDFSMRDAIAADALEAKQ